MTEQPPHPVGSDGDETGGEDLTQIERAPYPEVDVQDDDRPVEDDGAPSA